MTKPSRWSAILLLALLLPQAAHAQKRLRVYISADMEGITGVASGDQLGVGAFEYERFRGFMTAEVNAAIQGVRDAGPADIVIGDSHGNGESILIEKLPPDVTLVRSWPRPLGMMEGIDSTFDAVIFLGYHASSVNPAGVRAHTISSARFTELDLNGTPMPEAGLNAAIAGYYGVPVALVTGDDVAVAEIRKLLGNIEGAVVKHAVSFHSTASMTPDAGQALIREKAKAAVQRLGTLKPYKLASPVRMDLSLKSYRPAELLAYLPMIKRTGARSIQYTAPTILEVSKFLEVVTHYSLELEP